jgi:hypothetical protein
MRPVATLTLALSLLTVSGCRSSNFIETTIRNDGDAPLKLIEVDYPSASFGTQSLAPHSVYHYHFKVQGSGPVTLSYVEPDNRTRTLAGPTLSEGDQGALTIAINPAGQVSWQSAVTSHK